jgi:hypothetical protein
LLSLPRGCQVSDAVLDACLEQDPYSKARCAAARRFALLRRTRAAF